MDKQTTNTKNDTLRSMILQNGLLPALAVFTGLVIGGIVIIISNDIAITAWGNFFQNPLAAIVASWNAVINGYGALFAGALGNPGNMISGFSNLSGDRRQQGFTLGFLSHH